MTNHLINRVSHKTFCKLQWMIQKERSNGKQRGEVVGRRKGRDGGIVGRA